MNILLVSNSDICRSRMAQKILSSFGHGTKIFTSGVLPGRVVPSSVVGVMEQNGYDCSRKKASDVDIYCHQPWDYVITLCEDSNSHNRVEFTSNDGVLSINWEDVLAVFSAKVTGAEDGTQVASLDDTQVQQMRDIMWEMNAVSSSTRTESHEVEVTEVDEDGKETTRTETVTETILEISLTHKTAEEMAQQYNFNARQNEYLALMSEPENQNLWAELLGGFNSGGGQIMNPNTDWEGTGIFQWPLPQSYTITSWFGYREDPFTGEIAYHSGTDIGAPGGTPILTAADGTVTIANAIDTWGGGYGYYIKINHNDTFDTLYAHCSSICVTVGQEVKQGEVIGYVGTTGNSTGNHLHFEVWQNGERTDALGYFKAKE